MFVASYLIKQANQPELPVQTESEVYPPTPREKHPIKAAETESPIYKTVTLNGWDPATKSTIDPINLWKNYETRSFAGAVRHGEKVKFIKRQGDGVLIETKSGLRG